VLLGENERLHLILRDFLYFIALSPYVENVDNGLAFGAG